MIAGIVVVHSGESVPEDTAGLCQLSNCTPVSESCGQYAPSQEAAGGHLLILRQSPCLTLFFLADPFFFSKKKKKEKN